MSKTVLITGASSGIGKATAQLFAAKGWNVAATMRSPKITSDWAIGNRVIYPRLDVTVPETIKSAISETLERFNRIDVLVNNAGYALMGPLEGLTPKQLEHQFQTNVFGVVSVTQQVLPILRRQGGGTIINVASIGGRLAFPLATSYHASKWAIDGLSEALRYELQPFGIRVKIIEPGGIKTDFINRGTTWATHPAYTKMIERVKSVSERLDATLPGPKGVAKTIYRAAVDRTQKLRYAPYGQAYLLMHAILPDALWRTIISNWMLGETGKKLMERF
ncbi:SDR family oxidoreductase [Iningainema tapete]|uniref:SDR family oxidoreductase n=1 Tax=Iningainema tapete BLCC-T55 TaxID=2748662 RepID=A0A8J6XLN2_9CYAN|nr:SDR family oxidoreductase [Iningainema tapete]MBD2775091.1 SDR family oxidoreductase [Iningainema tapete BLCC-T55]